MKKVVIVGSSAAGSAAAEKLKNSGGGLELTIISDESYPAYRRDMLWEYLSGKAEKKDLFLYPPQFYNDSSIKFMPETEAARIDVRKNALILKDKTKVSYDLLIIASGRRPVIADIPGKNKKGVFVLYRLADAEAIKERAYINDTVCIIGGYAFCLRTALALADKLKDIRLISREGRPVNTAGNGFELIADLEPEELIGEGQLQALKLNNGKVIAAAMAIFARDYVPNTGFLKDTGINRDGSGFITVDQSMRTNMNNIFACGSAAVRDGLGPAEDKSWQQSAGEGIIAAQSVKGDLAGAIF